MTYESALAELQRILQELQDEQVSIDELTDRTRRAAELIQFCRDKLRHVKADLDTLFPTEA